MRNSRSWKKFLYVFMTCLMLPLGLLTAVISQPQRALADASFVHPGMIFTQADLDGMKQQVASNQTPAIYEWNNLKANPTASLNYAHPTIIQLFTEMIQ